MSKTTTQTKSSTTSTSPKTRQARLTLARVPEQLAELATMNVGQLRDRHRELFNEASASRNKDYLRKKLTWRIQELADGGLTETAKKRIAELDKTTPGRRRFGKSGPTPSKAKSAAVNEVPAREAAPADRDPRLPPPGTILRKKHKDVEHQVKVLVTGFEYKGERYKSLSKVARLITGTTWNGFGYFAAELRAAGGEEA